MERTELDHFRQRADSEVRERFPDAPIQRVEVLQYGDDPEVEPGQFLIRVTTDVPADRAEAVRWTLARIRERPAYEQLRTHAREIEELKSQF